MEEKDKAVVNAINNEFNKIQESDTKKTDKTTIVMIITCVVAFLLIVVGVIYYNVSRNNKRVIAAGITNLTSKFDKMLEVNNDLKLGKNYTISGNVKLNVESNYLDTLANIDEYRPFINLINNLGKTNNNFSFQQNLDSKKSFRKHIK